MRRWTHFEITFKTVDRVIARDMLIVTGDWNARPDPEDMTTQHILGRFDLSTRCTNGDRLVNFASANRLLVSNTHFQKLKRNRFEGLQLGEGASPETLTMHI